MGWREHFFFIDTIPPPEICAPGDETTTAVDSKFIAHLHGELDWGTLRPGGSTDRRALPAFQGSEVK